MLLCISLFLPFATFRYAAEFGRYRGIADIERFSAGNDVQRITHLCHSTINFAAMHCNVLTPRCGNMRPSA